MFWNVLKYDVKFIKEIHYQKNIIEIGILIILGHQVRTSVENLKVGAFSHTVHSFLKSEVDFRPIIMCGPILACQEKLERSHTASGNVK